MKKHCIQLMTALVLVFFVAGTASLTGCGRAEFATPEEMEQIEIDAQAAMEAAMEPPPEEGGGDEVEPTLTAD